MILRVFAGLIVFLVVIAAKAQDNANATTYKIRHIMVDQSGVIAETSNPNEVLKPGQVFVATFPTGKQCSITLKQQIGAVLMLNTSACRYWQEITKATPIEGPSYVGTAKTAPTPAPIVVIDKPAAEPAQAPARSEARPEAEVTKSKASFRRLGLSIYYSFANEIQFKEGATASGSSGLEATYKTDGTFGLGLSFVDMAPSNWGVMGNFFYEAQRNINSPTSTGANPKISFLVVEGCLVYRWDSFYMPFGLNYSLPISSDLGGSSVSNNRSFGVFFGTGVLINDRSSLEFFIRALAMRLTEVSGTTTNYETGSMPGFGLGYKFWF